jgi:hypothetical protein
MREQHLLAVAFISIVACTSSTEKGKLRPEGPPEILEVFMYESVGDGLESTTEFNLAFGCEDPRTLDCAPEAIASVPDREQPRMRLCCDRQLYHREDDGLVSNAVIGAGQKIRIILDELLRGPTVEQFVCGCADPPENVNANCQGGPAASLDPLNCEDNPNTDVSEASRFSDKNLDGVPDKTDLLPGMVEVYCDGLTEVWSNVAEEGWYNPSGNQQVPANVLDSSATRVILEWDSVGPAVVLQTALRPLPSSSSCHLRFREDTDYPIKDGTVSVPTARDKDGNPVPEPEIPVTFNTEAMRVINTLPMRNAVGQAITLPAITVTFNTSIATSSIGGITVTDMAGAVVDGTASVSMDGLTWQFDPAADLLPSTRYTVTIPTTVTDSYGAALPAMDMFSFTTGAGA